MAKYVLLTNKFNSRDDKTGERIRRKKGDIVELGEATAHAFRDLVEHVDVHKAKAKVEAAEAKIDPESPVATVEGE